MKSKLIALLVLATAGCAHQEVAEPKKDPHPSRDYIIGAATVMEGERKHLGAAFDMVHKEHVVGEAPIQAIPKPVEIPHHHFSAKKKSDEQISEKPLVLNGSPNDPSELETNKEPASESVSTRSIGELIKNPPESVGKSEDVIAKASVEKEKEEPVSELNKHAEEKKKHYVNIYE